HRKNVRQLPARNDRVELDVVILQRGVGELQVQTYIIIDLLPGRVLVDGGRARVDAVAEKADAVALFTDWRGGRLDQILRKRQVPGGNNPVGAWREIGFRSLERYVRGKGARSTRRCSGCGGGGAERRRAWRLG